MEGAFYASQAASLLVTGVSCSLVVGQIIIQDMFKGRVSCYYSSRTVYADAEVGRESLSAGDMYCSTRMINTGG
jgi:hypothetical protein